MPGADRLVSKFLCDVSGVEALDDEGQGRSAARGVLWVCDPVEFDVRDAVQAVEELCDSFGFGVLDPVECVIEALRAGWGVEGIEGSDVVDRSGQSSDARMILGTGHPSSWDGVWGGAKFVGADFLHPLRFAVEDSDMRSEEFVTRADQVIAVPGLDIDTSVRCIVDSIDEEFRAGLMGPLCDGGDIGQ